MFPIFPAATKGDGKALAFPDVCKVPSPGGPVPTPMPNIANFSQANGTSTKVKFDGQPVFTMQSKIPRTQGDEAGTLKGVVSSTNMDQAVPKAGCAVVKVEGAAVVRQMSPMAHNGSNANAPAGFVLQASQTKVIVSF
jgi:hypothetical protein